MSLGIGVIGAGVMGADHVRTIAGHVAGARVVAVCDQDAARAKAAAEAGGAARAMSDPAALIAASDVEAVLIASPDETHEAYTLACIAARKPVLCEKPLAPRLDACQRIVEAEQATGRRLVQVGFMRRFDPAYEDMKRRFATGELGAALMLHCVHRNATAPSFFHGMMIITNSAVHEFDISQWLLGSRITQLQVFSGAAARPGAVDDPLLVVAQTDAGQLIDIELFMNARYGYDIGTELVCERGTLTMQPPYLAEARLAGAPAFPFAPDWRQRFADAYRRQLQAWVDSIRTGRAVGASAWDGLVATAIADAGCRAHQTKEGVVVELPSRPAFYA